MLAKFPNVRVVVERFHGAILARLQRADGTFALRLMKGKDPDLPWWVCLAICRSLARWEA